LQVLRAGTSPKSREPPRSTWMKARALCGRLSRLTISAAKIACTASSGRAGSGRGALGRGIGALAKRCSGPFGLSPNGSLPVDSSYNIKPSA